LLHEVLGDDWACRLSKAKLVTKAAKRHFAQAAARRLGIIGPEIESSLTTAVPRSRGAMAKDWSDMVKEGHKQNVFQVLKASRLHDNHWRDHLNHWPRQDSFEILCDNRTVAGWTSGSNPVDSAEARREMKTFWRMIEAVLQLGIRPRDYEYPLVMWVPRALTAGPDLVGNICMDLESSFIWQSPEALNFSARPDTCLRWIGDGGAREKENKSVYATVCIAWVGELSRYLLLGMVGVWNAEFSPAWIKEAQAVKVAVQWMAHLKRGGPRPKVFDSCAEFPIALRGLVERTIEPWVRGVRTINGDF